MSQSGRQRLSTTRRSRRNSSRWSRDGNIRPASRDAAAAGLRVVFFPWDRNLRGRAPARADRLAAAPRASGACLAGPEARSRERLRRGRCPPSFAGTLHMKRSVFGSLLGSLAALARDDVGGVPPRPVVLRSGRFVLAVVLLGLSQKVGQSRDVRVRSSSGKPRLDLLEQPAVAVRIAERGKCSVGATVGSGARRA